MSKGLEQKLSLNIEQSRVFKALTNAEELMKWFPSKVVTDPKMGGKLRYEWKFEDSANDGFQDMEYIDFVDGQSFSHTWDASGQATVVTFSLSGANGQTDIHLTHTGWDEGMEEAVEMHNQIWTGYMSNLKVYLEEGGDMRSQMKGQMTG
jgi:uncharacterized protein YndB with AHSA1/START domain